MFIKSSNLDMSAIRFKAYKEGHLLPVMQAEVMMDSFRYQALIKQLHDASGLDDLSFDHLYNDLLLSFASCVQLLPRQTNGLLGGLLSEAIARASLVMQSPENQVLSDLQKYALFSAAIFCDIGHVITSHCVMLTDKEGNFVKEWNPFEGLMSEEEGLFYKIYPRHYLHQRLQGAITVLLARQLMPREGFLWISSNLDIYSQWLDALNGDDSRGGGIRRALALIKLDDIMELLNALGQLSEELVIPSVNREGEAFFRWLRDGISNQSIAVNTADAMVHMVDEGVFIDDKIIKKFTDLSPASIGLFVVKHQVGNLLGIPQKCGEDFLHAMFFGESAGFSSVTSGSRSNRSGMVLNDRSILDLSGQYHTKSTFVSARQSLQSLVQQKPSIASVANTVQLQSDRSRGK
tara:strand:+ start:4917 stop:6131 length:1215 start_codon:yes stop_codon:yes gene_type:complete